MDMNIAAALLIVSVICAPAACLASQSGDRRGTSVRPAIIFVDGDETDFVIDLAPLPESASFEECQSYTNDKCFDKYGTGGNEACAAQYLAVCTERLDACNREGRRDCQQQSVKCQAPARLARPISDLGVSNCSDTPVPEINLP